MESYFHFRARVREPKTCRARALARARTPYLACAARELRNYMRPKKTILCVDHNEQSLAVRKFMLETRGYRVLSALSSQEALEIFRNGGVDLVLSDLMMPQMDGNEMVRRMKDISPEIPTILVSATVKAFERANRADAFLPKDACTPIEVLDRIRLMVARKRGPKKVVAHPVLDSAREAVFNGAAHSAIA
jgi:two-component system response regulator CpxR